jgi:hypothetical protein
MKIVRYSAGLAGLAAGLALGACTSNDVTAEGDAAALATRREGGRAFAAALRNTSVTPPLVKALVPGLEIVSVISSDDTLPGSPAFVFGGSADGTGLIRNADGTFTMIVNHEDNFAVSRVTLDETFAPVKGEYVLDSGFGLFRLCSATLATPEEHGFGPLFITAGESGPESQIHAVDPFGPANSSRLLTAFGQWSTENAVPLPKRAYPGRTVVVIGDDDSGPVGGQLALYVSDRVGDLENGALYVMARPNDATRERDMVVGESYEVEFRRIPDPKTPRGAEGLNPEAAAVNAIAFGRVEDIDYRKAGTGRDVFFVVTGQANTGVNADYGRTKYGRVYHLHFDARNPLKGTLRVLLDGDDRTGPAGAFQNPDNILVTQRYVYVQEDPNGYGDETHDSYVYQYDLVSGAFAPVIELDHRRNAPDAAKYNGASPSRFGSWEYGAMLDVTEHFGGDRRTGTFLIAIQPHTWRGERYRGVDGGTLRPNENQASQMILVRGLAR